MKKHWNDVRYTFHASCDDNNEARFRKEKNINVCLRMNTKLNLQGMRQEEDQDKLRRGTILLLYDRR